MQIGLKRRSRKVTAGAVGNSIRRNPAQACVVIVEVLLSMTIEATRSIYSIATVTILESRHFTSRVGLLQLGHAIRAVGDTGGAGLITRTFGRTAV